MTLWKQITLSVLEVFALLLAGFIAFVVLLGQSTSDMCADTLISETPSPSGKLKAVLFQVDCGATTGFNSHVAIMPSNSSLSSESQGIFGSRSFLLRTQTAVKLLMERAAGQKCNSVGYLMLTWKSGITI